MRINFISNLPADTRSGGWTGANVGLYEALRELVDISFVGPINPGSDYLAKVPSKIARTLGGRGSFHFFSRRRLDQIAAELRARVPTGSDCNFFFGNTPWINYESELPYFVYTDCSFDSYLNVYHKVDQFSKADVDRIKADEARWLRRAELVFVATSWAAEAMRESYGLSVTQVKAPGMGGAVPIPDADVYEGGLDLLFIAYDFVSKGGPIAFETLKMLESRIPALRLVVMGGMPPKEVIDHPRVKYVGKLNKSVPEEFARYQSILEKTFLLIHPSMADIGSASMLEAAYYGCPALGPNRYCYTDQVLDQVSGYLIDLPLTADKFAAKVLSLYEDGECYRTMRKAARQYALDRFTWDGVARSMLVDIEARLAAAHHPRKKQSDKVHQPAPTISNRVDVLQQ